MFNESEMREADRQRQNFQRYLKRENYDRMNDYQKKQLLEAWRMDPALTNKQIYAALEMTQGDYYKELDRLDILKVKKAAPKRRQKLAGDPKKQISSCTISFSGDPQQLLELMEQSKAHVKADARGYHYKMELEEIAEN